MSNPLDLSPLYKEPDANIKVTRRELMALCMKAERALDGGQHDASDMWTPLEEIRETLAEFLERTRKKYSMTNKTDFIKRSSCGCNVGGQGTEEHPWSVHHCPMHEAVLEMLEALRGLIWEEVCAALAKAEGKP